MEKDYSGQALIKFLDYASERGLVNQTTAQSRKTAFLRIVTILEPEERKDLRKLEFDDAFARFQTRFPHDMTPESFVTYKSRAKKALEDFLKWVENPAGFKSQPQKKPRVAKTKSKEEESTDKKDADETAQKGDTSDPSVQHLRVLIRGNVLVQVSNLPFDLKQSEAERIKKIIDAHVLE